MPDGYPSIPGDFAGGIPHYPHGSIRFANYWGLTNWTISSIGRPTQVAFPASSLDQDLCSAAWSFASLGVRSPQLLKVMVQQQLVLQSWGREMTPLGRTKLGVTSHKILSGG